MAARQASVAYDQVTQKWRDLAERRRAHFVDLYESGRWKLYYTEEQFFACMQDVTAAAEAWARIAPRPSEVPSSRLMPEL
jgi:uncharacterized repeat protein (TIGR03809 family)